MSKLDHSKIDNITFDDIDYDDYPDFVDAFIGSAEYDGEPMNECQVDEINEDSDFVHEELMAYLY